MTSDSQLDFSRLLKAELHVHLEGSIWPGTVVELAARNGVKLSESEVAARYAPGDFARFIEAYKWVTSFLREPRDFALIAERFCEYLLTQGVAYAEITLSVGVMLLRKQDPLANFEAIRAAAATFMPRGLRTNWIFDAARQFGLAQAMEVSRIAAQVVDKGVVAYGIGGDELAIPTKELLPVYEFARGAGLNLVIHAGEIGPASAVRDAVEILGVARVGHGLASMHDESLLRMLAERNIPLEVCPTSNIRTGALAKQLAKPVREASLAEHPLKLFLERGVPVVLGSDDPAMFETSLLNEYAAAARLGVTAAQVSSLARAGFAYAFLSDADKRSYLEGAKSSS
ncbi:MAG TPA: adenosine deaminase [Candidatus Acidoferrales bacterium]|nr:adenosine deaminase [Candidatus Acidoferrales bacterium]